MQKSTGMAALALAAALPMAAAAGIDKLVPDQILKAAGEMDASLMIYIPCGIGILFSIYLYFRVASIKITRQEGSIASVASFEELNTCE